MKIKFKKLDTNAIIPTYGSNEAAGADLYAFTNSEITIFPHETVKIKTGIAIEIPEGYFGGIFARSGIATKQGLAPANKVGVIDSDYRGELIVALHNHSNIPQCIEPMERVAQLIIMPYIRANFNEVSDLSDTQRNNGGFGSTGVK